MPRFYLPPSQIQDNHFQLTGSEAHHALHVMRLKPGDAIDLFDGKDRAFRGRITGVTESALAGEILSTETTPARRVEIWLYAALIKGPRWDWLLQKASEVGVDVLVPIQTARTIVHLESKEVSRKLERWHRIALEAAKQCGRSSTMDIRTSQSFTTSLAEALPGSLLLFPWEKENRQTLRDACSGFYGGRVGLWIGPEGGWEETEACQALERGAKAVTLGANLLRSETAGVVAAALVAQEFFLASPSAKPKC